VSRAVGVGSPVALAVRVLETTVALRRARRPVPAVDADARRSVADVEATAAVAVARAHLPETHPVRQQFPRKPADRYIRTMYDKVAAAPLILTLPGQRKGVEAPIDCYERSFIR